MRWLHLAAYACVWHAAEAAIEAHVVFPHIDEDGDGELTSQELQDFMERGKVRLMVNFFGRETPVELDFLQVEKV